MINQFSTTSSIVNQRDIDAIIEKEPIIKKIHEQYGKPPNWKREANFDSLVQIILEQQVSLASAKAHYEKLKSTAGGISPSKILALSDEQMRESFISRQKSKYLRGLSEAILNKTLVLKDLEQMEEDQIRAELTKLKGIGNWTANVYMLMCLQHKDIFPIGDIALLNSIRKLSPLHEKEEILTYAEKNWKPLRSLTTFYFWHHYLKVKEK